MNIPEWTRALVDMEAYPVRKGRTFERGHLLYETYGLLIPIFELAGREIRLRELQPIPLAGNGFRQDAELEQAVYEYVVKPYLRTRACDSVFMRINSESLCELLQKQKDIDIITDRGGKNATVSIKAVRDVYERIFWEYEKNNNTHEAGWGLYSEATWHFYLMTLGGGWWRCIIFQNAKLRERLRCRVCEMEGGKDRSSRGGR